MTILYHININVEVTQITMTDKSRCFENISWFGEIAYWHTSEILPQVSRQWSLLWGLLWKVWKAMETRNLKLRVISQPTQMHVTSQRQSLAWREVFCPPYAPRFCQEVRDHRWDWGRKGCLWTWVGTLGLRWGVKCARPDPLPMQRWTRLWLLQASVWLWHHEPRMQICLWGLSQGCSCVWLYNHSVWCWTESQSPCWLACLWLMKHERA